MKPAYSIIPVFIPMLGCPNACVFCDQRRTAAAHAPAVEEVRLMIEARLKTIPAENKIEIGFFGGSFTGIPIPEQEAYLSEAQKYLKSGVISAIRISTRPDLIDAGVLERLKFFDVSIVEIGAQSFDPEVLKLSGRGHTVADIVRTAGLIREAGFSSGLQMMTGLPGDTKEKSIETAGKIVQLRADCTRIYPALVIKGTAMEKLYHEGLYRPQTLMEAVDTAAELFRIFEAGNVTVLRAGLHPSEGLQTGSDLVAGPYHPAFRELVETKLWQMELQPVFMRKGKNLFLEVPAGKAGHAAGHAGTNKKEMLKRFQTVSIHENESLSGRQYHVRVSG